MPFPARASAPVCRPLYLRLFIFIYRTRAKLRLSLRKFKKKFKKLAKHPKEAVEVKRRPMFRYQGECRSVLFRKFVFNELVAGSTNF